MSALDKFEPDGQKIMKQMIADLLRELHPPPGPGPEVQRVGELVTLGAGLGYFRMNAGLLFVKYDISPQMKDSRAPIQGFRCFHNSKRCVSPSVMFKILRLL